jgi:hypothetical protein
MVNAVWSGGVPAGSPSPAGAGRTPVGRGPQEPTMVTGRESIMEKQCCGNCIYSHWSLHMKLSSFTPGFPCGPLCANHPDTPGQLRRVRPGGLCRNYRPKPPTPAGDIKRIPVGDGQYAFVDAADYEWLKDWTWHLQGGYAARNEGRKTIYMHRVIMNPPPGKIVDHHDHNKLNNCRSNLHICTHQENQCNLPRHADSSSRFKGVTYCKRRHKWHARLSVRGVPVRLGYFDDEVEAARAYDRKAVELHGEFAWLNFPEEWTPEQRQQVYAAAQPLRDALKRKAAQAKKKQGKSKKAKGKKAERKSTPRRANTPARKARKPPGPKAKQPTRKTKSMRGRR